MVLAIVLLSSNGFSVFQYVTAFTEFTIKLGPNICLGNAILTSSHNFCNAFTSSRALCAEYDSCRRFFTKMSCLYELLFGNSFLKIGNVSTNPTTTSQKFSHCLHFMRLLNRKIRSNVFILSPTSTGFCIVFRKPINSSNASFYSQYQQLFHHNTDDC